ncbi:MAG: murJ [Clostridiales bacterium]|jgi:putative peptidoglycan lipid II flippase|nr:murJ [Clostridiales bacterium]
MTKYKGENVGKATLVVMVTLFLSRILGFVRETIVAGVFGATYQTDAFYAAFAIPDMMYDLLIAGALSAGFMPVFTSYLAKDDEDGAWKAANSFITVAIIFIILFNIFGMVFAKYLVPLVAAGVVDNPEKYRLTVQLTRVMLPAVTFTVIAGLLKGILNSYKRFRASAFGPVVYNIGIILGAALLGRRFGIYGMAVGVIIGAIFNVLVQTPEFLRIGGKFTLKIDLKNPGYKKMLRLMGPSLIGLAFVRLNLLLNQNIASLLDDGSITALRYAQRIMLLPIGIFSASISTTIFPTMSSLIARKEYEEFKKTFSLGLRILTFITVPSSIGLIALNIPIVRLLFKHGAFTEGNLKLTALALGFYSIGIIGQSIVPIIIRGFYSIQDTKTPVKIGFVVLIFNLILNLFFVRFSDLAIGGIAFSTSLTSILEMILLYRMLGKRIKRLKTRELMASGVKSTIASIIMGVVGYLAFKVIDGSIGHASKITQLLGVGVPIVIAIIVYVVAAYMLKMPELNYVVDMVRRKVKRGR